MLVSENIQYHNDMFLLNDSNNVIFNSPLAIIDENGYWIIDSDGNPIIYI